MSMLGAFGCDGAGAGSVVPQALLSMAVDQGSSTAALFCRTRGAALDAGVDLGGAADSADGGAERLKAEMTFGDIEGEETLVGGETRGDFVDAKPWT